MSDEHLLPGAPFPLGATLTAEGVNFAAASGADDLQLCLFDASGAERRIPLTERDGAIWHGFVPGVGAGQAYGYRAGGPYRPAEGLRYNQAKLLLDPYARAIDGEVRFGPEVLGHSLEDPNTASGLDSAGFVPRSLVTAPVSPAASASSASSTPSSSASAASSLSPAASSLSPAASSLLTAASQPGSPQPLHAMADTVIYELHVKGFTATHPGVPEALRGTYAGLAHEASLEYLTGLGVTAVELLPVHHSVPERFLRERGLTNYWAYNTIGFFAPHAGYSAAVRAGHPGGQVQEFRSMVDTLHGAGLEVILDVVFNHTAESDATGPTLCHRGLDNAAYYRLEPSDPSRYVDTTGCKNTLNAGDPLTLRMITDSLRYWISEMRVDGFRFDLAPTLARQNQNGDFDPRSAFLDIVAQDPLISRTKLIAEPWDVGRPDSYQLGRFPAPWSEWNGRYRDTVRDFWRSHDGLIGEFADRLSGSPEVYASRQGGRRPAASVNLVTVHDGFTLRDLVTYDVKHNEANAEPNGDGTDDNRSWNCGVEGPTSDPAISLLRLRQTRALLTTLLLSAGVPQLLGGDEIGRTQGGDNNAYCQDNAISWFDWTAPDQDLLAFTRSLIALRRNHQAFRRRSFLSGASASNGGSASNGDLTWFTPSGQVMTAANWNDSNARSITVLFPGGGASGAGPGGDGGQAAAGAADDFLILINAWWETLSFSLPDQLQDGEWSFVTDTFDPTRGGPAGPGVDVGARSVVVLQLTANPVSG